MPANITMPQLSDTMTEGTVVKWHKKEGDKVKEGEKVADVETDKATMEMESSESGVIAAILIPEGGKVAVGAPLAIIAKANENPADVKKNAASPRGSEASPGSGEPSRTASSRAQSQPAAAQSAQTTKQPASAPINVPTPNNPAVASPAPQMSKPAPAPVKSTGTYNFDLIVIGGGPAGYAAAIRAGQLKKRVLCIEKENLGGTCLNWGCIPTKALLENGAMVRKMRDHAADFGISFDNLKVDFTKVISRSRGIADKLSKGIAHLFRKYEVKSEFGTAQVSALHKVKVTTKEGPKEFTAESILVCTGARARTLPGVDIDGVKVITSREAMILPKQPKKLAIIGAGAIGCEFADFYSSMGTEVTIVELLDHLLPIEDEDCSVLLEKLFAKRGIKVMVKTKTEKVEKTANGVKLTVSSAKGSETVEADMVLMAVGVTGNVENLFATSVPVELFKNHIKVDKNYKTNVEGIYAAGDVIGPPWLAHVAHHEAVKAVEMIFGHHVEAIDYKNIPGCTYTHPQVASMGLTEKKAREEKREIRVGKFPFAASGRALAAGESDGFVKLIFDAKYGELLGVHMIGENVTELLSELVIAKKLEATEDEIIEAMHPHPTLSEAVMEAAGVAEGRAIHL